MTYTNVLCGTTVPGAPPPGYARATVDPAFESESGKMTYVVHGLDSGESYSVRVAAVNALGAAQPRPTQPAALAPPRQQPDTPTNAHLLVYGGSSLRVLFNAPASNGGAEITRYRVEWDTSADFDSLDGGPLGSNTILVDPTSGAYIGGNNKVVTGRSAICATERDILAALNLPYRTPENRETWYSTEELGAANAAAMGGDDDIGDDNGADPWE